MTAGHTTGASGSQPWTGQWVADALGVTVRTTAAPVGVGLADLAGLAVRRNPRRAHLLVSRTLAKHVPTEPRLVVGAGRLLGLRVAAALEGRPTAYDADPGALLGPALAGDPAPLYTAVTATPPAHPGDGLVLGYAETATGLGHAVADALGMPYLHSTRRQVDGVGEAGGFLEEHSHASAHLLLPSDPALLRRAGPVVLVDDEASTGRTALNTVAALHALRAGGAAGQGGDHRYVLAVLTDVRTAADRDRMAERATALGVTLDVVALAHGEVGLPAGVLADGADLVRRLETAQAGEEPERAGPTAAVRRLDLGWPAGVPVTGRHGVTPAQRAALTGALPAAGARLAEAVAGPDVLVLGTEELMDAPTRLAVALAEAAPRLRVRFSSTTRSPVLAVDEPGYPIRTAIGFASHDRPADGHGRRHAYNVAPAARPAGDRFDEIVVVVDPQADTPALAGTDGLLPALAPHCRRVHLAAVGEPC
jgi:hypothetical protein